MRPRWREHQGLKGIPVPLVETMIGYCHGSGAIVEFVGLAGEYDRNIKLFVAGDGYK